MDQNLPWQGHFRSMYYNNTSFEPFQNFFLRVHQPVRPLITGSEGSEYVLLDATVPAPDNFRKRLLFAELFGYLNWPLKNWHWSISCFETTSLALVVLAWYTHTDSFLISERRFPSHPNRCGKPIWSLKVDGSCVYGTINFNNWVSQDSTTWLYGNYDSNTRPRHSPALYFSKYFLSLPFSINLRLTTM